MRILGVDWWDVICRSWLVIPLPDSLTELKKIVFSGRFDKVFVISRVSFIGKYVVWFVFWCFGFYNRTGIPKENVYFCRHNWEKNVICKKLGITDFLDDRLEVLNSLDSVEHLYAFNPIEKELKKYPDIVKKITIVKSWEELVSFFWA